MTQMTQNSKSGLTGMQKLLFCLIVEQMQGDKIRIRKFLTHRICRQVIESLDEEDVDYTNTVIYGEDDKYFYIQFAMNSGWISIIPVDKGWAISNYIRNNRIALTKDTKKDEKVQ